MKAVILAAGLGSRLRPITDNVPKCLVPVNGIRIIDKQIDNLQRNGITEIYVVSGYLHDVLDEHLKRYYPAIYIIHNERYYETNNMYSLYMVEPYVKGYDFLLMNADVYFDSNIISGMMEGDGSSKIACDYSQYFEESMKITCVNNKINHISKKISEKEYDAVSIDVYRISAKDSVELYNEVDDIILNQKDENSWTEVALDHIFDKTNFIPYRIQGRWFEIDNHDDLSKAETLFAGDTISKL